MARIIYPNGDTISVIIPSPKWEGTIAELAAKDVPSGVPYLIIDDADIPANRDERQQWTADFSNPDGYGA